MKNTTERPRRVLRLQRRSPDASVFSLAVPKDIVRRLGMEPGDRFRVAVADGHLDYEPIGNACPRCGRSPAGGKA